MARRGERLRSLSLDPDSATAPTRACDQPGCTEAGEFRAPRSPNRLNDYLWFCLAHVRAYNQAWDYYKGMGPTEIEAHLREDAGWQRPTWPLGRLGGHRLDPEALRDPLGVLKDTPLHEGRRREGPASAPSAPPELRAALDVLGLTWPLGQAELRARYKELAKRYHPDANGGDRAAEERLKDINRAYSLLRQRLPAHRPTAAAGATAGAHAAAE